MRTALLVLCAICSASVWAVEFAAVQPADSAIRFVSRQMGVPVEGRFARFTAQLRFDPAKPQAARAAIDIDMASIDAGSKEANEEVVGKNWFAVKQFPAARFVSSSVTALGGNRYQVAGTLTIKGVTREVSAPFTFTNGVFEGRYVLKRLDYGIGQGVWADVGTVADEVEVRFRISTAAK